MVWLSLFNVISIFVGYWVLKQSLYKNTCGTSFIFKNLVFQRSCFIKNCVMDNIKKYYFIAKKWLMIFNVIIDKEFVYCHLFSLANGQQYRSPSENRTHYQVSANLAYKPLYHVRRLHLSSCKYLISTQNKTFRCLIQAIAHKVDYISGSLPPQMTNIMFIVLKRFHFLINLLGLISEWWSYKMRSDVLIKRVSFLDKKIYQPLSIATDPICKWHDLLPTIWSITNEFNASLPCLKLL